MIEYSKDLPTYLQYCKDVVFSGLEPSIEDHEEEKIIDDLWDFYQKKEVNIGFPVSVIFFFFFFVLFLKNFLC